MRAGTPDDRRSTGADLSAPDEVGAGVGENADPGGRMVLHRALSDKSRLALLRFLEASDQPVDSQTLAGQIGLHVNTVRSHLGILVDAGLVTETRAGSGRRGRPRHGYRLVPVQ